MIDYVIGNEEVKRKVTKSRRENRLGSSPTGSVARGRGTEESETRKEQRNEKNKMKYRIRKGEIGSAKS